MGLSRSRFVALMSAFLLGLLALLLVGLPRTAVCGPDPGESFEEWQQRSKEAGRKMRLPRTDLATVNTPGVDRSLHDPEFMWSFLTSPSTPYVERMAVADRAPFPPEFLARLASARALLSKEQRLHFWGLKDQPGNMAYISREGLGKLRMSTIKDRSRNILGHIWIVPMWDSDYPFGEEEESAAPWPWQVQKAMDSVLVGALRATQDEGYRKRWIEECLRLPWSTEEEAAEVINAVCIYAPRRSPAILGRLMDIAKNPDTPKAALTAAIDASRSVGGPLKHAIIADLIRLSPHRGVAEQLAFGMRNLRKPWGDERELPLQPEPATAILAASELALDPLRDKVWGEWSKYAGFACNVCDAADDPPFKPDDRLDPKSPLVDQRLKLFRKWFKANRARLSAASEKEQPALDAARAYLRSRAIWQPEPQWPLASPPRPSLPDSPPPPTPPPPPKP